MQTGSSATNVVIDGLWTNAGMLKDWRIVSADWDALDEIGFPAPPPGLYTEDDGEAL